MRRFSVIFLVLATATAELANDGSKTTAPYRESSQNSSVIENAALYKTSVNNVVLEETHKKDVQKRNTRIPDIDTINDTPMKTSDDESSGFQKIIDLIRDGIQIKKEFIGKIFTSSAPVDPVLLLNEQSSPQVIQIGENPLPSAVNIKYIETVEEEQKPMAIPMPKLIVQPKQVITEVMQPTYSYKQTAKDGTVTSYEFEDNPNVIVTETVAMPPLPPYIQARFEEIVNTDPRAIINEVLSFGSTIDPENFGNVITPLPPVVAPIYPPAFGRLQNLGYFERGNFYGPPILVKEELPVLLRSATDIIKIPGPKGDVKVKISKNRQSTISKDLPALSFFFNGDLKPNSDDKMPPIRPPVSDVNKEVSGNRIISNDDDWVGKTNMQSLNISPVLNNNTNLGNVIETDDISNKLPNAYFAPSVKDEIQLPTLNIQTSSFSDHETIHGNPGPMPDNNNGSIETSPIVIPDTQFVYTKSNADGSSMSVKGSNNNVQVDVKESTINENRGDMGYYK